VFTSAGGGGFGLPIGGSPAELLVLLVLVAAIVWVAFRVLGP